MIRNPELLWNDFMQSAYAKSPKTDVALLKNCCDFLRGIGERRQRPFNDEKQMGRAVHYLVDLLERRREWDDRVIVMLFQSVESALLILTKEDMKKQWKKEENGVEVGEPWSLHRIVVQWHGKSFGMHNAALKIELKAVLLNCYQMVNSTAPEHEGHNHCVTGELWSDGGPVDSKQSCKHCNRFFNLSMNTIAMRCDDCAKGENECHLDEIIPVGKYENRGICPCCVYDKRWLYKHWNSVHKLAEHQHDVKIARLTRTEVVISFCPPNHELENKICLQRDNIPQRFFVLPRRDVSRWVKPEVHWRLMQDWLNRPKEIRYRDYALDLLAKARLYFKVMPSKYNMTGTNGKKKCPFSFERLRHAKYQISDMGPLTKNGFVTWPSLQEQLGYGPQLGRSMVQQFDEEMFNPDDSRFPQIFDDHCGSTGVVKEKMLLAGIKKNYKGMKACYYPLTKAEATERRNRILRNANMADLTVYWPKQANEFQEFGARRADIDRAQIGGDDVTELTKLFEADWTEFKDTLHEPALQVVDSKLDDFIEMQWPRLWKNLEEIRLLNAILNFALYTEHPQLLSFKQFLVQGVVDGEEKGAVDLMKYEPKYEVRAHVDTPGLLNMLMDYFGDFFLCKWNGKMNTNSSKAMTE